MAEIIENKIANSGLITIDIEELLTFANHVISLDLKDFLFQGLIIKEKEFREQLTNTNWQQFNNAIVAINCSVDAIIPNWSFMLLSKYLHKQCDYFGFADMEHIEHQYLIDQINKIDFSIYQDKKIILKGCGKKVIKPEIYAKITERLLPFASSIMYGEPCSTVPVYKKSK